MLCINDRAWSVRFEQLRLVVGALFVLFLVPQAKPQGVPFDYPGLNAYLVLQRYAPLDLPADGTWPPSQFRAREADALAQYLDLTSDPVFRLCRCQPGASDYSVLTLGTRSGFREWSGDRDNTLELSLASHIGFSKWFSVFFRSRATNDGAGLPGFTGRTMSIARGPFRAAETDYMFFHLHWSFGHVNFGRIRSGWTGEGPHSLVLAAEGPPLDGFSGSLQYRDFTLRFRTGYLESLQPTGASLPIHRYFAGHYLTYRKSGLLLTLAETMLYAGKARPFDFSYAIPLTTFFESDANHRYNQPGNEIDNAFIHFSFRYSLSGVLSVYGAFLVDELQIDPKDRRKIPDALASRWILNVPLSRGRTVWGIHAEYIHVDAWTYRYEDGLGNYQARGFPLGWWQGSDFNSYEIELDRLDRRGQVFSLSLSQIEQGEQDLRLHLSEGKELTLKLPSPSGIVSRTTRLLLKLLIRPWDGFWLRATLGYEWENNVEHMPGVTKDSWLVGGAFVVPFGFSLYGRRTSNEGL